MFADTSNLRYTGSANIYTRAILGIKCSYEIDKPDVSAN